MCYARGCPKAFQCQLYMRKISSPLRLHWIYFRECNSLFVICRSYVNEWKIVSRIDITQEENSAVTILIKPTTLAKAAAMPTGREEGPSIGPWRHSLILKPAVWWDSRIFLCSSLSFTAFLSFLAAFSPHPHLYSQYPSLSKTYTGFNMMSTTTVRERRAGFQEVKALSRLGIQEKYGLN